MMRGTGLISPKSVSQRKYLECCIVCLEEGIIYSLQLGQGIISQTLPLLIPPTPTPTDASAPPKALLTPLVQGNDEVINRGILLAPTNSSLHSTPLRSTSSVAPTSSRLPHPSSSSSLPHHLAAKSLRPSLPPPPPPAVSLPVLLPFLSPIF